MIATIAAYDYVPDNIIQALRRTLRQLVPKTDAIACGFVITILHHNLRIYHAGNTNIFSDMKLINKFYNPDMAILPIGDCLGMGPKEAALIQIDIPNGSVSNTDWRLYGAPSKTDKIQKVVEK